jgi:hypothetical protein
MLCCRFCAMTQTNLKFEIGRLKSHTREDEPRNGRIIVLPVTKRKASILKLQSEILPWPFLRAFAHNCS